MRTYILLAGFTLVLGSAQVAAQVREDCSSISKDVPFQSKVASASMYANLRNKPGSLRYETGAIFDAAKESLRTNSVRVPEEACPSHCELLGEPAVVFRSIPMKYLKDYSDRAKCLAYLEQTMEKPLIFADRKFENLEQFNNWYNEFSQGKGADGKDLYKRCDGSCSPQYLSEIHGLTGSTTLTATSRVVCGHARDKSDNMYKLSASFRWACKDASKKN